jgi:PadR family transcriptional regulator PadR
MKSEMLKGHLEVILLAALEAGPSHGYAIIEKIRSSSGGIFDLPEGSIYPALHRLEEMRLVSSTWENAPSGRRRRVYRLTNRGVKALAERRTLWVRFSGAIGTLLGGTKPWKTPA